MISKNRLFTYIALSLSLLLLLLLLLMILNAFHGAREIKRLVLSHELPALGMAASSQLNLIAGNHEKGPDFLRTFEEEWGIQLYMARRDGSLFYASDSDLLKDSPLLLSDLFGEQFHENLLRNQHKTAGISEANQVQKGSLLWGAYLGALDSFLVIERASEQITAIQRSSTLRTMAAHALSTLFLLILTLIILRLSKEKHASRLVQADRETTVYRTFLWALNHKLEDGERRLISLGDGLKQYGDQQVLGTEIISLGKQQQEVRHTLEKLLESPGRKEPFELEALLQKVITACTPLAFRKGVAIHYSASGETTLPATGGNPELVFLILEQCMVICITHTQEDGDLLLCIQPSREQNEEVILNITFSVNLTGTECPWGSGLEEATALSGIRIQWLNRKEGADTRTLQIAFPGV